MGLRFKTNVMSVMKCHLIWRIYGFDDPCRKNVQERCQRHDSFYSSFWVSVGICAPRMAVKTFHFHKMKTFYCSDCLGDMWSIYDGFRVDNWSFFFLSVPMTNKQTVTFDKDIVPLWLINETSLVITVDVYLIPETNSIKQLGWIRQRVKRSYEKKLFP